VSCQLQRLVITFDVGGGITARVLYRTKASPGPGTQAHRLEVTELTRAGLKRALTALDAGDVQDLGTSGFTQREDVLGLPVSSLTHVTSSPLVKPKPKGG
jgi:hypothetical protein